jgi:hypothetical protein
MIDPMKSSDTPDPLSLFGAETESAAPKNDSPIVARAPLTAVPLRAAAPADVIEPAPSVLKMTPAPVAEPIISPVDGVDVIGPSGAVSFSQICAAKPPGFVEGVALVQATCEVLNATGSATAGVPELDGVFLNADGTIVLQGPPTGDPAAKQLARLLHQMVPPEMMPPAGRLFVGRWIDSEATDLSEFASELAYFARPNGHELLVGLHRRCEGAPATNLRSIERRRYERPKEDRNAKDRTVETPPPPSGVMAWVRAHKPALAAAVALVAGAVTLTAIGTLLWAPGTVAASKEATAIEAATVDSATPGATPGGQSDAGDIALPAPGRRRANSTTRNSTQDDSRRSPSVLDSRNGLPVVNQSSAIESPEQAADVAPALTSRTPPDLRIYSAGDSGVEPPRLRSAELPELLIAGFERRQNRIELVISERGEVQHARMIGEPQRMPDVMLLSRAKELQFDPAVRNGVPVRYRLVLTWNVTP